MPAELFDDHRALVAAAETLLTMARRNPRPDAAELTLTRMRLARLATKHNQDEDETIIRPLMAKGLVDQLPGAAEAITAIRASRAHYSDHIRQWTTAAVLKDWDGYAAALVEMIDYLKQVVALEEKHLYWPALRLLRGEIG